MSKHTIQITALGDGLRQMLDRCMKHNQEEVAKAFSEAPLRFQRAALEFYPTVLHVRHGFLRNAIQGFAREPMTGRWEVGLGNRMAYAAVQELGFDGIVTVREHTRKTKGEKIKYVQMSGPDFGRSRTKTSRRFTIVRSHLRQMHIRAKHFLGQPILNTAREIIYDLTEKFGWGDD